MFMIRKMESKDLNKIMEIWLNTNIKAHNFIDEKYWQNNYKKVKELIEKAEVYVYEKNNIIVAFVGLEKGYIAGIFVEENLHSKGIGTKLLNKCKTLYNKLSLSVYKNNIQAVNFYIKHNFKISEEKTDKDTNEIEYEMIWNKY